MRFDTSDRFRRPSIRSPNFIPLFYPLQSDVGCRNSALTSSNRLRQWHNLDFDRSIQFGRLTGPNLESKLSLCADLQVLCRLKVRGAVPLLDVCLTRVVADRRRGQDRKEQFWLLEVPGGSVRPETYCESPACVYLAGIGARDFQECGRLLHWDRQFLWRPFIVTWWEIAWTLTAWATPCNSLDTFRQSPANIFDRRIIGRSDETLLALSVQSVEFVISLECVSNKPTEILTAWSITD